MLINVSRKVLVMLMSRTSRLAVETLVELTGHGSQEGTNAAELGRRTDTELPFLKQVLNRLTRAGLVQARPGRGSGFRSKPALFVSGRERDLRFLHQDVWHLPCLGLGDVLEQASEENDGTHSY